MKCLNRRKKYINPPSIHGYRLFNRHTRAFSVHLISLYYPFGLSDNICMDAVAFLINAYLLVLKGSYDVFKNYVYYR